MIYYTGTLKQFYLKDWRHTHTFTQNPKEMEVATSLWSSPSLVTATPSSSGVVRELVPRAARVVRSTARTGFWGNGRGLFGAISALAHGIPGLARGTGTGRRRRRSSPGTRKDEPIGTRTRRRTLLVRPFCSAGLRPLLHPPSRRFQKSLEGGRSSSLAASHRVSTNREKLRHPSPFSPSATTIRLKIHAGEIRAGVSGGRFRREKFGREMSFRAFAAATPLLSPVPRRSWPRGACRMASGEDGGGECVEVGVVV